MFSLAPVTRGILTSRLWLVVIVATCAILARTSCQLHRNVLGKPQQKNHPLRQSVTKSRQKRQINLNNTVQDHHKYYNSQFYQDGRQLWKDLRNKAGSVRDDYLSSGVRAIKAVELSFEFPYYGHFVTNATLTTGGFINLGESKSRQVAEFQYVAPLMAHFNPSLNSTSTVHHFTDGNEFIVQWSNVLLHHNPEAGSFTFQCMLNKTGEIVFSYQKIPIPITNISRAVHPVDIGISDAYYVDKLRHYYGIWQLFRTFYTYDAVHINQSWPVDNAAVVFYPKPSCITARTCEECIDRRQSIEFNCIWCDKLERCSDGFDRHRAEWLSSGCNSSGIFLLAKCTIQSAQIESDGSEATPGLAPWIIAIICVSGVLLFASVAWLVYAFTHPNSRSGLWFIQHGPTSCCRGNQESYEDSRPTNPSVFNKVLT